MTTIENLPFSFEELQQAVEDKLVTKRDHDSLPYSIYNYTNEVQYMNLWNDITLNCRGLIVSDTGELIARPWKKFFNLGQVNLPIQFDTPVEVMDKADGSLGILYPQGVDYILTTDHASGIGSCDEFLRYGIATRGSFNSTQAWHATKVWREKYSHLNEHIHDWCRDITFLFEIIYPKNRIVLNYHGMDDLMLLGAVDNKTGYYLGPQEAKSRLNWEGPVVETYEYNTLSDALAQMGRENKEGYVIRSHNFMVKVKEPDYLDLHKLVTNLSPKSVWENLKQGKSSAEIILAFPDEFHKDVEDIVRPLLAAYTERYLELQREFHETLDKFMETINEHKDFNRSGFAKYISKNPDKHFYFRLLDGKSITDAVWAELRPVEEVIDYESAEAP